MTQQRTPCFAIRYLDGKRYKWMKAGCGKRIFTTTSRVIADTTAERVRSAEVYDLNGDISAALISYTH